jgi:hypothetical protein
MSHLIADQLNATWTMNYRASVCEHPPLSYISDSDLQDRMNTIVSAHKFNAIVHAKSLTQQDLSLADHRLSAAESFSEAQFEQHANLVLSQARARRKLEKSISMHQDCKDILAEMDEMDRSVAELDSSPAAHFKQESACAPGIQPCPFDVIDLPSPARKRAPVVADVDDPVVNLGDLECEDQNTSEEATQAWMRNDAAYAFLFMDNSPCVGR